MHFNFTKSDYFIVSRQFASELILYIVTARNSSCGKVISRILSHRAQGVNGRGGCVSGKGACVAGETATAADGTHPTGMHSCQ